MDTEASQAALASARAQLGLLLDQASNSWTVSLSRKEQAPDSVGFRQRPRRSGCCRHTRLWLRKEPARREKDTAGLGCSRPGLSTGVWMGLDRGPAVRCHMARARSHCSGISLAPAFILYQQRVAGDKQPLLRGQQGTNGLH